LDQRVDVDQAFELGALELTAWEADARFELVEQEPATA
jgi:hypothetical protein